MPRNPAPLPQHMAHSRRSRSSPVHKFVTPLEAAAHPPASDEVTEERCCFTIRPSANICSGVTTGTVVHSHMLSHEECELASASEDEKDEPGERHGSSSPRWRSTSANDMSSGRRLCTSPGNLRFDEPQ
mmetsp:Transcript_17647/g.37470  ORF Transcript_17647/g.37470 Transcript_17647/m.37470 type:complete len:129 (-) Transcript_17647:295-681(-)